MKSETLAHVRPGVKAELTGCRFGKLKVSAYAGQKRFGKRSSARLWLCQCDCGKSTTATTGELNAGTKRHCGCESYMPGSRSRNWSGFGEMPGRFWFQVRKNAEARSISVEISGDDAWALYARQSGKCALSGVSIDFKGRTPTASLDRIDSGKGYVAGNVWWVHKIVNRMKWTLSAEELVCWSKRIVDYERRATTQKRSLGSEQTVAGD